MMKIENDCVGCPQGCIDCGRREVIRYYCDKCGAEEQLFEYAGQELCRDCLCEEVPSVEGSY